MSFCYYVYLCVQSGMISKFGLSHALQNACSSHNLERSLQKRSASVLMPHHQPSTGSCAGSRCRRTGTSRRRCRSSAAARAASSSRSRSSCRGSSRGSRSSRRARTTSSSRGSRAQVCATSLAPRNKCFKDTDWYQVLALISKFCSNLKINL